MEIPVDSRLDSPDILKYKNFFATMHTCLNKHSTLYKHALYVYCMNIGLYTLRI